MTIEDKYPPPLELFKTELKTFEFIYTRSHLFAPYYSELISEISTQYSRLKAKINKERRIDLFTRLSIVLDHKEYNTGKALLGIDIARDGGKYQQVSYSVTICRTGGDNESDRILRKYHFDYTSAQGSSGRQPHPVFHLQYAGKLSKHHISLDLDHTHITCDSWLSEPRISIAPMSYALMLNMVFKEFPDEVNQRIIETPEWRSLVKTNEDIFLKPYFEHCSTFLNKRSTNLLTNDFWYGHNE